jgi:hypothetical protein
MVDDLMNTTGIRGRLGSTGLGTFLNCSQNALESLETLRVGKEFLKLGTSGSATADCVAIKARVASMKDSNGSDQGDKSVVRQCREGTFPQLENANR